MTGGVATCGAGQPVRKGQRSLLRRARTALLLLACHLPGLDLLSAPNANAQASPARIEAPAVLLGGPASELSLDISIKAGALPANSYVRIRGLAPQMALTDGHAIGPGSWAVSIAAIPDLRVIIPAGVAGKNDVSIALVAIDGGVVAEARTTLIVAAAAMPMAPVPAAPVAPPPPPAAPQVVVPEKSAPSPAIAAPPPAPSPVVTAPPAAPPQAASPPPPPPAAPSLSAVDRERAFGFVTRGNALLLEGNIVSARLFFTRAANAGLAEGALALAETFDPNELARLRAIGVQPDVAEARRWYEKARALGATEAEKRLMRLGR
ncbi:MAG: sel1 repeat family protein [Proteobacteria bacterium]|nr:sel1 repeat family protein [Pseudomonadota bacterium]